MRRSGILLAAVVAVVVGLAACDDNGDGDAATETVDRDAPITSDLAVTSDAFADGGAIPEEFSCDGAGDPPSLAWSDVAEATEDLLLVVDDPDVPSGTFTHWVVWGLDPAAGSLAAGSLPADAIQGANGTGGTGWIPPCPPPGDGPHRYEFELFALSAPLDASEGADADTARAAAEDTTLATTTLTGTYER